MELSIYGFTLSQERQFYSEFKQVEQWNVIDLQEMHLLIVRSP